MRKLIVVDLQRQFKDGSDRYSKCLSYVRECYSNYDEVIATVFSQEVNGVINPSYVNRLGWNGCKSCDAYDLDFQVPNMRVLLKNTYGCSELFNYVDSSDALDIIGCDIDTCVLAICFQLWDAGINFRVLMDYVYTAPKGIQPDIMYKSLCRNFGQDSCYYGGNTN